MTHISKADSTTLNGTHAHSLSSEGSHAHLPTLDGTHTYYIAGNVPTATKPNTVTLDTPIHRGEQTITEITLRKPNAGELRGTTLNALANLEVDALSKILPRIASPMLTYEDVMLMDPADLVQLGVVFAGFLTPKHLD